MTDTFDLDEQGNIKAGPVLAWKVAPAMGTIVLVQITHAPTPEALKTGGERLQTHLSPQQAIDLARSLEKAASRILAQSASGSPS